jgi:hypothetical protein
MADIFSDSNRWFDFGSLSALPTWQLFSSGALNGNLFEVKFLLDWTEWNSVENLKFKSYCLLRFYYRKNGIFNVVEESRKLFIKPENQVIRMPIPSEFQNLDNQLVTRVPGFRYQTFKKAAMDTPDAVLPWALQLRYLIP